MTHCLLFMVHQFSSSLCFKDFALGIFCCINIKNFYVIKAINLYFMFSFFLSMLGNAFPTLRQIFIWNDTQNMALQLLLFSVVLFGKGLRSEQGAMRKGEEKC